MWTTASTQAREISITDKSIFLGYALMMIYTYCKRSSIFYVARSLTYIFYDLPKNIFSRSEHLFYISHLNFRRYFAVILGWNLKPDFGAELNWTGKDQNEQMM